MRGAPQTIAELEATDQAADRLDGRDVDIDVDPGGRNTAKLGSLSGGFRGLASNIKATRTVLLAAAIPAGIAAIGAGIPTIAALAASIGGLGVALGSGLVGGAVAATAALGGLAGAFALIATPVSMLLGNLKDYDDSLESVKSAEDAARTAAQARAESLRRLSDAQATVASTARESREAVAEQEEALRRTRAEGASAIAAAERSLAEARRSGTQGVREAEASLAQTRRDAARAIAEQEQALIRTRATAAQSNAQAEEDLEQARDELTSSTRSLVSAQEELNRALREEPLNQEQAVLDLAFARDRASDSLRAYNEAVAEYGRNSEEASDARRDLEQANLDLQRTEIDVRETQRKGSQELRSARDAARSAAEEQRSGAEAVQEAEQGVLDTRAEGVRQVREQQMALRQTRADEARQVAEQERGLAQARAERLRSEREAAREVAEVRIEAAREVRDQEEAVAEAAREGAQRVAEAQAQVAAAQRAAAQASKAAADAQVDLREETVKLTPAQKALFDEYKRFEVLSQRAFLPAQNASARLGVEILRLAESYLPRLGRSSDATIAALSRAFDTFRTELSRPVEQAGITRYLALIPTLTEEAATAAGRLSLALFNVFSRSLRYALPLTRAIGGAADEFLRWTESARGTRAIDRFFEDSVDMALRLLPAIEDLAAGFGGLVGALQRTGIVDQSVRGFRSLAESFAESTRAGGGLDTFLRNARDLMPFVADAAKAVGGALLGIASAAIGAREKGSRLTILQGIFKNIGEAARPLQDLVVGTFRNLGPAIAELLPSLTRFFDAFGEGASQTLATFVNTLTRALNIFNDLPPNVKRTVGQLAALKIILGGLGITALVAPMGRFASNMLLVRGAAARLGGKAALPAVVGSIARLGTLLAGGLGLGLLAAGLFRAYQKNEDFRKSVNNLGDKAGQVFQGISNKISKQVLPALTNLADKGAKAIIDIFDLGEGQGKQIQQQGVFATRQYGLGIRQGTKAQTGEGTPAHEFGFKIGRTIGAGLNAWAQGGKGEGGQIDKILNSTSNPVHVGEQIGQGVRQGLNNTKWNSVGARLAEQMGEGATNPAALKWIQNFIKKVKSNIREAGWGGTGARISSAILQGFVPIPVGKIDDWANAVKDKARDQGWQGVGKNIMLGIKAGMDPFNFGKIIIDKIEQGRKDLANWQQEGSPAKLWMPHGRNAALGYLAAFGKTLRDGIVNLGEVSMRQWERLESQGWQGRPGDNAERLYAPRPGHGLGAARAVNSPGGKSITAAEMRQVMREHRTESRRSGGSGLAQEIASAVITVLNSKAYASHLDRSMGGYFALRNAMGADPR